jgi:hypothetical protein
MIDAAGHENTIEYLAANYWWTIFLFGGIIGVFFEDLGEFLLKMAAAITGRGEVRHQRQLELERARAKAAKAQHKAIAPGPCRHFHVQPVYSRPASELDEPELVAWACLNEHCRKQLPANFAVFEEEQE